MNIATYALSDWFSTCGQLQPEDLAGLARSGFRAVINNRPDGEVEAQPTSAALAVAAQQAGVAYAHLPVVGGQIDEQQIQEMTQLLQTLPRPILAFCRSGTRSSYLFQLTQHNT
jgi:uncharacterized protein (TIGR01244 family)